MIDKNIIILLVIPALIMTVIFFITMQFIVFVGIMVLQISMGAVLALKSNDREQLESGR